MGKQLRTSKPCACAKCKSACETRPGWPTPEEAERIIDAGHAKKLMYDWWEADESLPHIGVLSPAAIGCGGKKAPEVSFMDRIMGISWGCEFHKQGKCELHGTNMKPFECRISMPCTDSRDDVSLHKAAAIRWNSKKGRAVLLRWQTAVIKRG